MAAKEQTITVKMLSGILGLIALIGSAGIYIGTLVSQVEHHGEDLKGICTRLEKIEEDVKFIKDRLILQKKLASPLVESLGKDQDS